MNRFVTVFICTLKKNIRDRGSLLEMLLLPIVIILILGNALSPLFTLQKLGPTTIGYLNLDTGPIGASLDSFIVSDKVNEMLTVRQVASYDEGLEILSSGDITALISLDANFTAQITNGEQAAITMTHKPVSLLRVSVVENILESFISTANLAYVTGSMGAGHSPVHHNSPIIVEKPVAAADIMPTAVDYYAVTMLVMIIMYGAFYSATGVGEAFIGSVGSRLRSTPVRNTELYFGLVLGNVVTICAQVLLLIAFTKYVYQVNWGNNLLMVFLITIVLIWTATGLGAMLVMITRNTSLTGNILNVTVPVLTFLAGGYFKISLPGALSALRYISPNYLAQTAIFNTIYGGDVQQTIMMIATLCVMAALMFIVTTMAQRRCLL